MLLGSYRRYKYTSYIQLPEPDRPLYSTLHKREIESLTRAENINCYISKLSPDTIHKSYSSASQAIERYNLPKMGEVWTDAHNL
jgi:hypothetical protein